MKATIGLRARMISEMKNTWTFMSQSANTFCVANFFFSKFLAPKLRLRPICEGDLLSGV